MKKRTIVSTDVRDPSTCDAVDRIAEFWSLTQGREISRSDVLRCFIEEGVEKHDPSETDLEGARKHGQKRRPGRDRLRLVNGSPTFVAEADDLSGDTGTVGKPLTISAANDDVVFLQKATPRGFEPGFDDFSPGGRVSGLFSRLSTSTDEGEAA